jgi:hypothetical protein
MKAKVTAPVNINNAPATVGSVVDVDANTFRNLVIKGRLAPVNDEAPEVENREADLQTTTRHKKTK